MTTEQAIQGQQPTTEDDAAFWRLMGCKPVVTSRSMWCGRRGCELHDAGVDLAPILSDPSADASWLAMRDVLAELERRGWEVDVTIAPSGEVSVALWVHGPAARPLHAYATDLPRAVAEAAAQAALGERDTE